MTRIGFSLLLGLLAVAPVESYAAIIVDGGSLTGVTPSTIGTGYGSFDATHSDTLTLYNFGTGQFYTQQFVDAHVYGSTSATGIALNATAQTIFGDTGPSFSGYATGTVGFDLTDLTVLTFSWYGKGNYHPNSSLNISSSGNILLGCVGTGAGDNPNPGGCSIGSLPVVSTHGPLDTEGTLTLAAGHYDLAFSVASGHFTGTADKGSLSFNLAATPVPLPATLPLLFSALAGLGVARKKDKTQSC